MRNFRLLLLQTSRTPVGLIGLVLSFALGVTAVVGPLIAPQRPNSVSLADRLQAPSTEHWFGTDELGRDIFSRVLDGGPRTILSAMAVVTIATLLGILIGATAGFVGGAVDNAIMRVTDIFIGYPALLLAIAIAAALGQGQLQTILALVTVWWAGYARLARGEAAVVRELEYVDAARLSGRSRASIMLRHIMPNILSPVIVKATLDVALVVEAVAALGFIGLGVQAPAAEWGSMISDSRGYALQAWWYPIFPGLALLLVVMAFNLLGDGISKVLGEGFRAPLSNRRAVALLDAAAATRVAQTEGMQ